MYITANIYKNPASSDLSVDLLELKHLADFIINQLHGVYIVLDDEFGLESEFDEYEQEYYFFLSENNIFFNRLVNGINKVEYTYLGKIKYIKNYQYRLLKRER